MEAAPDKARAAVHYPALAALARSLTMQAVEQAKVVQSATIWPWVITIRKVDAQGKAEAVRVWVEQAPAGSYPDPFKMLPEGVDEFTVDMLPASRFDDMAEHVRPRYVVHYKAYLRWRAARALGKTVADMQCWKDYDPVGEDERVQRWLQPIGRYCGD